MKRLSFYFRYHMSAALAAVLISVTMISCAGSSPYSALENGDLIFQANTGSDFVSAIEAVTKAGDTLMSFSHVGIICKTREGISVLEATPEKGVCVTAMEDFLRSSAHDQEGHPLVRVMRYTGEDHDEVCGRAIERAMSHLGKGYDFAFDPGMEAVYCSELVFGSYVDSEGNPIFRSNPMTFKDSSGETSPLWVDYYAKLGKEIPEGEMGTNPNDMSREVLLETVPVVFP